MFTYQNDSCSRMGSDESHFNVSLISLICQPDIRGHQAPRHHRVLLIVKARVAKTVSVIHKQWNGFNVAVCLFSYLYWSGEGCEVCAVGLVELSGAYKFPLDPSRVVQSDHSVTRDRSVRWTVNSRPASIPVCKFRHNYPLSAAVNPTALRPAPCAMLCVRAAGNNTQLQWLVRICLDRLQWLFRTSLTSSWTDCSGFLFTSSWSNCSGFLFNVELVKLQWLFV